MVGPHGKRSWIGWVVLAAVAGGVFFTHLGAPRLWDRDEPRNAGCAREMLARGDWVVPVFNDELRDHKPVLLYWLIMSAYGVFGVGEFAARFWSAALAVGTVAATSLIGRRLFDAQTGFWSGIVLASSLMFAVAARAATPDSTLIFLCTLAMLVYVQGAFPDVFLSLRERAQNEPPCDPLAEPVEYDVGWLRAAAMYALLGLAVLAKGPVGVVLPMAVIGMFLLLVRLPGAAQRPGPAWRRWSGRLLRPFAPRHFFRVLWSMRPLTAMAVVLAVALPWYVLVGLRTEGAFLRGFFLTHNLERALQPMENHRGPVVFYLVALCAGFLPWSLLLPGMVSDTIGRLRAGDRQSPAIVFGLCWIGVYLGLFSLAQTKLPSYITPCYPAVAILCGAWLVRMVRGVALGLAWWPRVAAASLAVLGAAMAAGVTLAAAKFLPGDEGLGLIGLVPLAGGGMAWRWFRQNRPARARAALGAAAVLLAIGLMGIVAVRVDRHQTQQVLWDAVAQRSAQPRLAAYGCLEPSWIFYTGRPIVEVPDGQPAAIDEFLAGGDAFLITTDARYQEIRDRLPPDTQVLARTDYFLRRKQLLVLCREPGPRLSARPAAEGGRR